MGKNTIGLTYRARLLRRFEKTNAQKAMCPWALGFATIPGSSPEGGAGIRESSEFYDVLAGKLPCQASSLQQSPEIRARRHSDSMHAVMLTAMENNSKFLSGITMITKRRIPFADFPKTFAGLCNKMGRQLEVSTWILILSIVDVLLCANPVIPASDLTRI